MQRVNKFWWWAHTKCGLGARESDMTFVPDPRQLCEIGIQSFSNIKPSYHPYQGRNSQCKRYSAASLASQCYLQRGQYYLKLTLSSRKALLLGAGFVVKPTLTHLSQNGVEVTVGAPIPFSMYYQLPLTSQSLPDP